LLASGSVLAATNILDLGRPTNTVSPLTAFPLSGFHHVGKPLHRGSRAELIFLGTQLGGTSSVERWPVIKTLTQFGSLRGVRSVDGKCQAAPIGPYKGQTYCGVPTYDWSHASFQSRYLYFDHKDLLD
jgi:hypothetical protein